MSPNVITRPAPAPMTASTGPAPDPTTRTDPPASSVRILMEIDPQRISISVRQQMGPYLTTAGRIWRRLSRGQWRTVDADWSVHEDNLAPEVIDYLAGLDFPSRIAEMLPNRQAHMIPVPEPDSPLATIDELEAANDFGARRIGRAALARLREQVRILALKADALAQLVALADRAPFTAIGHAVEHAVPQARVLVGTGAVSGRKP